jgi:ADP-ribose pyrophosphatase
MIEELYRGRFLRLVRRGTWEYAERLNTNPPVGIVAVTPEGKLLLVEQMRPPIGCTCIELPAGLVGDLAGRETESFETAAIRELEEETGFTADHIAFLTQGPATAGLSSEQVKLVRATGLRRIGPPGGDGTENITLHEIPLAEVHTWLANRHAAGTPIDPKVYAGLYFVTR